MIPGDLRKHAPDDAPGDVGTIDPEGCLVPKSNVTNQERQSVERFLSGPTVVNEDIILDLLMYDLHRIAPIHLTLLWMDRWMDIAEIRIVLLSIVIINIIPCGFSAVLTATFPQARMRLFRSLGCGFTAVRRAIVLRRGERLDVYARRLSQTLLNPFDETDAGLRIQFPQELGRLIVTAAQILLDLSQGIVDKDAVLLVIPAAFGGQSHAIQQKAV